MNRPIVLLLLLLCTFTLMAQPHQLPASDFRITDSMPGFAANHRYDLRIATNGQNFLAGWIDERTGWEARRLIVTRLDRGGNALDGEAGTGIALGEPWNVAELSIASDGVDYLAVWRPLEGDDVQLVRIDGGSGAVTQLPSIDDSAMYTCRCCGRATGMCSCTAPTAWRTKSTRSFSIAAAGARQRPERSFPRPRRPSLLSASCLSEREKSSPSGPRRAGRYTLGRSSASLPTMLRSSSPRVASSARWPRAARRLWACSPRRSNSGRRYRRSSSARTATVHDRMASGPQKLFGFVPELAQVDLVQGGPKPLVVYRA